jgi:hypothetical protein
MSVPRESRIRAQNAVDSYRAARYIGVVSSHNPEPIVDPVAYANLLLATIEADIRHVHVRATVSLALAAVLVTQIDLADLRLLDAAWTNVAIFAIVTLGLAGVGYFMYTQFLNRARLRIVAELPTLAGEPPPRTSDSALGPLRTLALPWSTRFMRPKSEFRRPHAVYYAAQTLFVLGAIASFAVVAELLAGG